MTATKIPEGSFLVEEDSAYHDIAKGGLAVSASALKVFDNLRGTIKPSTSGEKSSDPRVRL